MTGGRHETAGEVLAPVPPPPGTADDADEPVDPLGAAATIALERESRQARRARRRATAAGRRGNRTGADPGVGSGDVVEYVFEPYASRMPRLGPYLRGLRERRHFLVEMAKADLRGPRSNTVLGRIWTVLDPIFQAAIYFFLFTVIRGNQGSRTTDFIPILLGGIFLFQLTTGAMGEGGRAVLKSRGLMLNSAFPRALLPLASLYKGLLGFVPSVVVFVPVYFLFGGTLHAGLLLLPVVFALQMVLNVGLALLMSTIIVFFRDAQNALGYVTRILFFATPIIYPLALLPEGALTYLRWQPLYGYFASYQRILGGGMPRASEIALGAAWAAVLLVIGARVFLKHERGFGMRL